VVVVVKLHSTTKDAVRRFQKTLANTSASVLGVVATGAAGGIYGRYGYGYGYGYYGYGSTEYANGNGAHRRLGWLRRARPKQKA
jgi:Mrp family chromosome partitioning ATPase